MTAPFLCALGHLATTSELARAGVTTRALRNALDTQQVMRLRRGTFACAHLTPEARTAAHLGGAVTCVSVLRDCGVWAGNSTLLHVQLPRHSRLRAATGVRVHWEEPRFAMETPVRVGRMQALWRAIHCLDEEHAIAAMESALRQRFLSATDIRRLGVLAPRRLQPAARRLNASSGSGNETIVRRRLERAGYRVDAQALVPGMGHGDLLIEDCVALEIDGRQWHGEDRYALDHERDLRSEGFGRRVLRISTSQIHVTWPSTMSVIERVVNDTRLERDRRYGRLLVRADDQLERG